jgi:hypothetical protein
MPSRTAKNISPEALKQFNPFIMNLRGGEVDSVRQQSARDTAGALAKVLKERFRRTSVTLIKTDL